MGKPGPETRLIAAIRKHVRATPEYRDVLIVKQHGSAFSEVGVSDLLCCVAGVFVAVEVKAPEGRHPVSVKQQAFGDRVLKAGGAFGVVRSVEEFCEILDTVLEVMEDVNSETSSLSMQPDYLHFTWGGEPDPTHAL
jgi:hypothetical protein